jgi:hypothetical protein
MFAYQCMGLNSNGWFFIVIVMIEGEKYELNEMYFG